MKYYIILAILLTACGSDDSSDPATQVETKSSSIPYAMSLENKSDLPDCTEANANQLVYVKSEKQFYECDGDWTTVSIKGSDGRDGEDGRDGDVLSLYWTDDVTGYEWFMGSTIIWTDVDCPNGFELPADRSEARTAVVHGLYNYYSQFDSAPTTMWTDHNTGGNAQYILSTIDSTPTDSSSNWTDPVGMYCVNKG